MSKLEAPPPSRLVGGVATAWRHISNTDAVAEGGDMAIDGDVDRGRRDVPTVETNCV